MNQRRNSLPRDLDILAHLAAELIRARRVASIIPQKRDHGIDHFRSDAGRGIIAKIAKHRSAN